MYIKMKQYGGYSYWDKIPTKALHYVDSTHKEEDGDDFYYFKVNDVESYSFGYNYKFKRMENVVKLIEDMIMEEHKGELIIYDLDKKLNELEIELKK